MTSAPVITYILVGLALAADAGSVSLVYGGCLKPFKWRHAAVPAAAFGVAQAVMPALGWRGGELVAKFVRTFGHWIAFAILLAVGIKFIIDSRGEEDVRPFTLRPWPVLLASFATSIDACAVGFGLSMNGEPIAVPALIFGTVTFLCSMICCRIGSKIGEKFGPKLLLAGGIVLILIGLKIVVENLAPGISQF